MNPKLCTKPWPNCCRNVSFELAARSNVVRNDLTQKYRLPRDGDGTVLRVNSLRFKTRQHLTWKPLLWKNDEEPWGIDSREAAENLKPEEGHARRKIWEAFFYPGVHPLNSREYLIALVGSYLQQYEIVKQNWKRAAPCRIHLTNEDVSRIVFFRSLLSTYSVLTQQTRGQKMKHK